MTRAPRLTFSLASSVGLSLVASVSCSSEGLDRRSTPQTRTPNQAAGGSPTAVSLGGMSGLGSGGSGALGSGGKASLGSGGTHAAGGTMVFGAGGGVASGSGGNPSSGGAGNAPTAGGSAGNLSQTASQLDGFRIEIPCIDHFEPNDCHTLPADAAISRTLTFGGIPGTTYEVTLRMRGLIEAKPITGGSGDSWFVVGGTPNDNAHETALELSVASPVQRYFFNSHEVVGDVLYNIDYMAKIQVAGGSTLTFIANDVVAAGDEGDMASNWNNQVVEGILPAPLPFDGQFVQFNVVSVDPPL